jgi:DNA repair protein RecO
VVEEKTEAIVLSSLPYLRGSRILKVFTRENGLVGLIGQAKHTSLLSSSLVTAEFVYRKKKTDLYSITDLSVLSYHFELRKSYEHINAASEMAKALIQSQMPGRGAPLLYELFQSYLRKLPSFSKPSLLSLSFAMKILSFEGLIHLSETCTKCPSLPSFLTNGEPLCLEHSPHGGFFFSREEWSQLLCLTLSKSFAELETLTIPAPLVKRLYDLFESFVKN